ADVALQRLFRSKLPSLREEQEVIDEFDSVNDLQMYGTFVETPKITHLTERLVLNLEEALAAEALEPRLAAAAPTLIDFILAQSAKYEIDIRGEIDTIARQRAVERAVTK